MQYIEGEIVMAHNKQRGKYFEDKVAAIIRTELGLNKGEAHRFYESGMATGEYGDIRLPYPWVVECKYYQDISLDTLVFSKSKRLKEWFTSLNKDAKKYESVYNKKPLKTLITSRPHFIILTIIPLDLDNLSNDFIDISRLSALIQSPLVKFEYEYNSEIIPMMVTDIFSFLKALKQILNKG
jgi:hypothetical protein